MSSIANKISQIAENSTRLYQAGYDKARQESEAISFGITMLGNDTNRLSFKVPFQPDDLAIMTTSPYYDKCSNTHYATYVQPTAYAQYAGIMLYNRTGTTGNARLKPSHIAQYFTYDETTNTFTLDFSKQSSIATVKFRSNMRYHIMAHKYSDYSIRDAIIEEINLLPDIVPSEHTGTLTYNQLAIYSALSEEEWIALTAQKSNWTFVLE